MAITEAAFAVEIFERRHAVAAPAGPLDCARSGKQAGEIDGNGSVTGLDLEWPRELSHQLVIIAALGGEVRLQCAPAPEGDMEPHWAQAILDGNIGKFPCKLDLGHRLRKVDIDSAG